LSRPLATDGWLIDDELLTPDEHILDINREDKPVKNSHLKQTNTRIKKE